MERRARTLGRLSCFLRARLQRRLFVWFTVSILVTAVVVVASMMALGHLGESSWRRDLERAQTFAGNQFARAWDSKAERDALAEAVARDLDLGVRLKDPSGATLKLVGAECRRHGFDVPVSRAGERLGTVTFCLEGHRRVGGWRSLLPIALGVAALWMFSGRIARKLSRPLVELARVAEEIGGGNLKARARLPHAHGEVGAVAEAVNEMAARIERQLADQRELLAAVSHELRTPLARIRLLTEMARDNGATPKTFEELDREVMEIDSLVGDLLASSRIDFAALSARPLDPRDVARRALERAGLDPARLSFEADGARVSADATLLARALANLIDNARRHGGGLERLAVRAPRTGFVAFEVEDAGPGLPAGQEARLFEPFQGLPGRARADGLGLGLALVRRIALAHGGTAYAQNRPGGGARVGLELPVA